MTIQEIKSMPTSIVVHGAPYTIYGALTAAGQYHESLLRSFHLLRKTKEWLAGGVPGEYVLEMIADIEDAPKADPYVAGER
jgi:hypothetical protein